MKPLDLTRLEKALADHGFDLTPAEEEGWLRGRSTQHPLSVWLRYEFDGSISLAAESDKLRDAMVREDFVCLDEATEVGMRWRVSTPDYSTFHRMLGRFAALARSLPNQVATRFEAAIKGMPASTEAERLVVQRIGQNLFREALIDYWQGRCAVTGLDVVPLLRASHIKPWAKCESNEERLDVFNGLLLAPHLDALFDSGWISFLDEGAMLISEALTPMQLQQMGIQSELRLAWITDAHRDYLAYHRAHLFQG